MKRVVITDSFKPERRHLREEDSTRVGRRTCPCRRSRRCRQPRRRPPSRAPPQTRPLPQFSAPKVSRSPSRAPLLVRSGRIATFRAARCSRSASRRRPEPKRTGSSATSPVSASACRDRRPRRLVVEVPRVERDAGDGGRSARQRESLVELDELGQREQRMPGVPVDLGRPCQMAEHEGVRRRPVDRDPA